MRNRAALLILVLLTCFSTASFAATKNVKKAVADEKAIRAVWEDMRTALASGDVEGAVGYFSTYTRAAYRMQFKYYEEHGTLKKAAAELGHIQTVLVRGDTAIAGIRTLKFSMNVSYTMSFVKEKGVWKIESL